MKTSARNQFKGTITEIKKGQINSEIVLSIDQGVILKAIITNESVDEMSLVVGEEAYAIIKASFVMVAKDKPTNISTRNIIETKVLEVKNGMVNGELKMLMGDQILTAVITEEAVEELDFKVGDTVYALIKANLVVFKILCQHQVIPKIVS
jgi:molybdate transport system regulatory protein